MLKIGEMIAARVYREEAFGVFLRYEGNEIFIHLPELSWTDTRPANMRGLIDQVIKVKIIDYISDKNQWVASARKADGVENPYLQMSKKPIGFVFDGKIFTKSAMGHYFVRLENGAIGRLEDDEQVAPIKIGADVSVSITYLEPYEGHLGLTMKLAAHDNKPL
jgi:ribosomal protein S1